MQQFFEKEKNNPDYLEYLYQKGENTLPELDIKSDIEILIRHYW